MAIGNQHSEKPPIPRLSVRSLKFLFHCGAWTRGRGRHHRLPTAPTPVSGELATQCPGPSEASQSPAAMGVAAAGVANGSRGGGRGRAVRGGRGRAPAPQPPQLLRSLFSSSRAGRLRVQRGAVAGLAEPPPPGKCLTTGPRSLWQLRACSGSPLRRPASLSPRRPEPVGVGLPARPRPVLRLRSASAGAGTAVGLRPGRAPTRPGVLGGCRCSPVRVRSPAPGGARFRGWVALFRQGRRLQGLITWRRGVTSVPASQVPSVRPVWVASQRVRPGPHGVFFLPLHPSHSRFIRNAQPGSPRASYSGRGHTVLGIAPGTGQAGSRL